MSDNYNEANGSETNKTPQKGGVWWKIALAVICLAYIIAPIDFIPDLIPGLGQVDDLGALVGMVTSIIAAVKGFKAGKASAQDDEDINDVESN